MVTKFHRPRDAAEAHSILKSNPAAVPLAGGTWLLTGQFRDRPMEVVSIEGILPSGIERSPAHDGGIVIRLGSLATFQAMTESEDLPAVLRQAARGMADRNVRNRATVGGNIGANKSCASLLPVFHVAEGLYETVGEEDSGSAVPVPATLWKQTEPARLISRVLLHFEADRLYAYRRWSRTACDISVITAAVSFRVETGLVREPRVALGGMGASARRFPAIEAALEGVALPAMDELVSLLSPFLDPKTDARGSAGFKRYRAACLLAEALLAARAVPEVQP